jgi:cytochrome b subunit of formate dehydrogenase
MEMEELVKWVIFAVILVVLVTGIVILLKGRGGEIFSSIKDMIRIGA